MPKGIPLNLSELFEVPDDLDDCWIWLGRSNLGYGVFYFDGEECKAHRLMYELSYGSIPERFDVHHKCCVKLCVNPSHLEALSRASHIRVDCRNKRILRGFARSNPNRARGESLGVLTESEVVEIRDLYATGNYSYGDLSDMFLIGRTTVGKIVRKITWRHV